MPLCDLYYNTVSYVYSAQLSADMTRANEIATTHEYRATLESRFFRDAFLPAANALSGLNLGL